MADNEKNYCPNCGIAMNHHADKINEAVLLQVAKAVGSDFNGAIEAVYACQMCGQTIEQNQNEPVKETKQSETNATPIIENYQPRISRRLRFTYTRLL
jgi:DNA-directed RNA polymerase subunit RPC12/RpoP